MDATDTRTPRRSLIPLWILVAIFAMPMAAAWFFYLNPQFLPEGRTNRGELIDTVVTLPQSAPLTTADGAEFDPKTLEGKWTLVALAAGPCEADCRRRLTDLRQIRLALGESRLSVERLVILRGQERGPEAAELTRTFEGMHAVTAAPERVDRLAHDLGTADAPDRTYILDPMGRLMMRYAPDAPADHMLKDSERLLKASKNWIKGAQYGHR